MTPIIHRLAMFRLQDGQGQLLYAGADSVALFVQGSSLLAHYRPYPQLVFLVTGWRLATGAYQPASPTSLLAQDFPAVHRFVPERFSVYTQANRQLQFKANVTFDLQLFHWLYKKPGTYVLFTADSVQPIGLPGPVPLPLKQVAVSHLQPASAWF